MTALKGARGIAGLAVWLACVWLAGCAPPVKREQLIQEVLKADPTFAQVLDKHREIQNRIETYDRELALKRSTVEHTIAQLRKDLAAAVSSVRQKTAEAKKRMEPDRARLDLALSMAGEELQAKRVQRASLGRSIAHIQKSLKDPRSDWSEPERTRQEAQIREMLADAHRFDQEMASMQAHLRLLKIKLLLIKL